MDATPKTGKPSLIGSVIISGPLQLRGLARAALERKEGIRWRRKCAHAPREIRRTGNRREHFRGGSAESAVAGDVAGKGWRHEIGLLIRHPVARTNPSN